MLIKNNHGVKMELPSDQNTAAHIGRKDPLLDCLRKRQDLGLWSLK